MDARATIVSGAAITAVLKHAKDTNAKRDRGRVLDFAEDKNREQFGRRKTFRHTTFGFPTTQFKNRVVAMASTQGLAVMAVDPALHLQVPRHHLARALATPAVFRHPARKCFDRG